MSEPVCLFFLTTLKLRYFISYFLLPSNINSQSNWKQKQIKHRDTDIILFMHLIKSMIGAMLYIYIYIYIDVCCCWLLLQVQVNDMIHNKDRSL